MNYEKLWNTLYNKITKIQDKYNFKSYEFMRKKDNVNYINTLTKSSELEKVKDLMETLEEVEKHNE